MSHKWMNDAENLALCHAWIAASEDPIKGSGLKYNTFWQNVTEQYNELKPKDRPERSFRSLESKFSQIRHDALKFGSYYAQIVDLQSTGTNVDDTVEAAQRLYTAHAEKEGSKGKKSQFQFLECWRYLKDCPKWQTVMGEVRVSEIVKQKPRRELEEPDVPLPMVKKAKTTTPTLDRPIDVKAAKRLARLEHATKCKDDAIEVAAKALADAVAIRAEAQMIMAHTQVFRVDITTLDDECRRYFQLQRRAILADLEKRAKAREEEAAAAATSTSSEDDEVEAVVEEDDGDQDVDVGDQDSTTEAPSRATSTSLLALGFYGDSDSDGNIAV
ncbi:hypothetical protein SPRG_06419 [Saprolegnia parasitica CBS 223.65]|uniref:No apical meristem-associated C-terminal domain-containing protein n=1 Tax=Saprolegnia parasitica (strain CBS 223.65) TaxID=695850 RepID=A0A067CPU2_SAPPC|nr:hypothetical protein SPRG_06419 [Saprolegnia parasitica CBS 223.65]KDO28561.1 hypothetical protein SPRG_06419 [Saprolegnia parasitica CBS 223.65]|eukprot:XP_012200626.1 hypothetical protein SPRG_06419 [Saprolegnia parasitica CBS 223.65]